MHQEILKHVTSKIELSKDEQREFVGVLSEKRISKKEFLIEPGQSVNCEYYVVKGCLKAYYLDRDGNKHIIQFAVEDWWISDFEAFFGNYPAQLYVEAIEDSILLGIHRDTLETLYKRIPKFERFFRIKTTKSFVALRSRILSSLQKNNKERYLEFCQTYPEIEKRVPNYHIANYLGIKPESLSRLRKELF
jgi:CRP-like cAMP-binding protein